MKRRLIYFEFKKSLEINEKPTRPSPCLTRAGTSSEDCLAPPGSLGHSSRPSSRCRLRWGRERMHLASRYTRWPVKTSLWFNFISSIMGLDRKRLTNIIILVVNDVKMHSIHLATKRR